MALIDIEFLSNRLDIVMHCIILRMVSCANCVVVNIDVKSDYETIAEWMAYDLYEVNLM